MTRPTVACARGPIGTGDSSGGGGASGRTRNHRSSADNQTAGSEATQGVHSPATDGSKLSEPDLLSQLVQLLGQRERHSLLLSDLGALLPGTLRAGVKEKGGLRTWLQRYPELFPVTGQPGRETVTLQLGSKTKASTQETETESVAVDPAMDDAATKALQEEEEDNHAAVQMRGLPYRAQVSDIRSFLGEHCEMLKGEDAVQLVLNRDGRPSGLARVQFNSPTAAKIVRDVLNMRSIEVQGQVADRYVEIFLYSNKLRFKKPIVGKGDACGSEGSALDPAALEVGKEQVVGECRDHMCTPGKAQLLLSMLGVALSEASRNYLKRTNQGLKHVLVQFPNDFSVEGQKGREIVSYLPEAGSGGDLPRSVQLGSSGTCKRSPVPEPSPPATVTPASPPPKKSPTVDPSAAPKKVLTAEPLPSQMRSPGGESAKMSPVPDRLDRLKCSPVSLAGGSLGELKQRLTPQFETSKFEAKTPIELPQTPSLHAMGGEALITPSDWGTPQTVQWDPQRQSTCLSQEAPAPCSFKPSFAMGDGSFGFRPTVPLWPAWLPSSVSGSLSNGGFDQILPSSAFCGDALGLHQSTALRLRGLPAQTTEQDIFAFFSKYDVVAQIAESGAVKFFAGSHESNGEAVVYMQSWQSAEEARKTLDGRLFGTSKIQVDFENMPGLGYSAQVQARAGYPAFINASLECSDASLVRENPQSPNATLDGAGKDSDYTALWNFLTEEPESLPTGVA